MFKVSSSRCQRHFSAVAAEGGTHELQRVKVVPTRRNLVKTQTFEYPEEVMTNTPSSSTSNSNKKSDLVFISAEQKDTLLRAQKEHHRRLVASEKNHQWVSSTVKSQLAQKQRQREDQLENEKLSRAAAAADDDDDGGVSGNFDSDGLDVTLSDIEASPELLSHELVRTKLLRAMKAIDLDEIPDLDWQQRKLILQAVGQKIQSASNSHHSWNEKAISITHLHSTMVEPLKLRLTTDLYYDIFHVLSSVLTVDATTSSGASTAYAQGTQGNGHVQRNLEALARQSTQPHPWIETAWQLYQYMLDSGLTPTENIYRELFFILQSFKGKDATIEAKAHALYVDASHAGIEILPAQALQSYFTILGANGGSMHLAVTLLADYRTRLEQQPTPGMMTAVVIGLLKNHQVSEALNLISNLHSVPVRVDLLKAMLRVMAASHDPLSAIAFYKAAGFGKGHVLTPDLRVFGTLFRALSDGEAKFQEERQLQLEKTLKRGVSAAASSSRVMSSSASPHHKHLLFLMQEMKQYGIKVSSSRQIQKAVLEGLQSIGRPDLAKVIDQVAKERNHL